MIPTARISRSSWQADREWKEKNSEGRLKAVWYPRIERIEIYRLSGPAVLEHRGHEVDYPVTGDQPTTWTIHSDPEETLTIALEWVPFTCTHDDDAERLGTVRDAHLMCRCMPTPADGHDQKRRRAGAEYDILYVCDEHCPDPGRVENKKVD